MIRKRSKRKFSKFLMFLIIYGTLLISIILILMIFLNGILKDYESSMPNNTMEVLINDFTSDNIRNLLEENNVSVNDFESIDVIEEYFKQVMAEEEISYKRKSGEFTNNNPVYVVMAGEKTIAKVTLAEKGKNAHDFTEWKVGEIAFGDYVETAHEIAITAPTSAEVKINGVTVDSQYITETDMVVEQTKNVAEYTNVATNVVYKIDNLLTEPQITAVLGETELPVSVEGNQCTVGYPQDDSLLQEHGELITSINQAYGKYIINKGSLWELQRNLIGNAVNYVSDIPAVWAFLYGMTYTYEFRNQELNNFVKYSDTCFSCDIAYDLYVKWSYGDTTYDTRMNYTFVYYDNKWSLADFTINY